MVPSQASSAPLIDALAVIRLAPSVAVEIAEREAAVLPEVAGGRPGDAAAVASQGDDTAGLVEVHDREVGRVDAARLIGVDRLADHGRAAERTLAYFHSTTGLKVPICSRDVAGLVGRNVGDRHSRQAAVLGHAGVGARGGRGSRRCWRCRRCRSRWSGCSVVVGTVEDCEPGLRLPARGLARGRRFAARRRRFAARARARAGARVRAARADAVGPTVTTSGQERGRTRSAEPTRNVYADGPVIAFRISAVNAARIHDSMRVAASMLDDRCPRTAAARRPRADPCGRPERSRPDRSANGTVGAGSR